jgi:hypothetical protein
LAPPGQEKIPGLDIAMNDSLVMGSLQSGADLDCDLQKGANRGCLPLRIGEAMKKAISFEQFHGDERPAFILVNLVDRANVGMI